MQISCQGMFGPIQVTDTATSRDVLLNGQRQGGAQFEPPASAVNPDELPDDAPGPVAESVYPLGWLLAGLHNYNGSGLMIGLGSGAGAVQLLYNFPQVDLTVVEIDPAMVNVAFKAYPLLDYYANAGKLNVVVDDANEYLVKRYDLWDFACADAYTGGNALVADYMPALCDRADNIYINCIDRLGGESMRELTEVLRDCDKPVAEILKAIPAEAYNFAPFSGRSNWIITSQAPIPGLCNEWMPFENMDEPGVEIVRRNWDAMICSGALVAE